MRQFLLVSLGLTLLSARAESPSAAGAALTGSRIASAATGTAQAPPLHREADGFDSTDTLAWPAITAETKPWSRWWWLGNIADEKSLTSELERYAAAGLGGLELTPIYGVRGEEDRFVAFLSPRWMELFEHTLAEARRLGLGIDLANGTGWPFGGPWLSEADVAHELAHRVYTVAAGGRLREAIVCVQPGLVRYAGPAHPPLSALRQPITSNANLQELAIDQVRFEQSLPLLSLMAFPTQGAPLDLTARVNARGELDWIAPADRGSWTLYALFQRPHGKMVERAAPGGEGYALDHFSSTALQHYLAKFDAAFSGHSLQGLRAFFNDSYEVDDSEGEADFTPRFFEEFQHRRGYDLRTQLPALFDPNDTRVISDYRETISDLLLDDFTRPWRAWAHAHGALIRNQAHGSPANILDLYAASDIPEQEGNGILAMKLASSAAHLTGKRLTSSETGTWLDEHFLSTLAELKSTADQFFLGGINHQCYHGTAFSPLGEPWPGFQFYASVELNPRNPFWDDFAAVNAYVTRVQSFLQTGEPDEDVLLYYNIHDRWAQRGDGRMPHFGHGRDPLGTNVADVAGELRAAGVGFDYVSDRLLQNVQAARYHAIIVPPTTLMPRETLARLVELAENGARVIFLRALPSREPGLGRSLPDQAKPGQPASGSSAREANASSFSDLLTKVRAGQTTQSGIATTAVGRGQILVGADLAAVLARCPSIPRETLTTLGLEYVRRRLDSGAVYFITHRGGQRIEAWVPLAARACRAALFDPMTGAAGFAALRERAATGGGAPGSEVFLQLDPGESMLVRLYDADDATIESRRDEAQKAIWPYWKNAGASHELTGAWTLEFVKGGPTLPPSRKISDVGSWTNYEGAAFKAFSGTARYTLEFSRPAGKADAWALDLGDVADSARVVLNGQPLGTLVQPPWRIVIPDTALQPANTLEVFVTNLAANRIADLDRRGVVWKKFYNTNFPARRRENTGPDGLFSAKQWSPRSSGLLGPVSLQALQAFDPLSHRP